MSDIEKIGVSISLSRLMKQNTEKHTHCPCFPLEGEKANHIILGRQMVANVYLLLEEVYNLTGEALTALL